LSSIAKFPAPPGEAGGEHRDEGRAGVADVRARWVGRATFRYEEKRVKGMKV